jgi:hypothetical protein
LGRLYISSAVASQGAVNSVKGEKRSYQIHYSLDGERLGHLRGVLGVLLQTKDE